MNLGKSWIVNRPVCWVVMAAFFFLCLPDVSEAALVQSRLSDGSVISERAQQLDSIRQALEREVVVQRLADFGFTPQEVLTKLETLDDEQLHQVAGLSDDLGAGGILGDLIAVLLIVLLVVVILQVSGKRIIVK